MTTENNSTPAQGAAAISEAARKRLEELLEEEEGAHNRYHGALAIFLTLCAVVMSLFHLYAAVEIVPAYILRPVHVAFALALVFLMFPTAKRFRHRLMWWDVIFAVVSIAVAAYILYWGDLLGDRATLPGNLPQSELAWIYASADVFVFPSTTEVSPNVVLEAKASGLPVVVAADHGGGQFVACSGEDGIVLTEMDAASWAQAIAPLVVDETRRAEIGRQARQWIEREWPDWGEVLERDLLAAWHEAARNGRYLHVDHARRWASS